MNGAPPPEPVRTLEDYQRLLWWLRDLRRDLVRQSLERPHEPPPSADGLREGLRILSSLPRREGRIRLVREEEREEEFLLDPSYEREELAKDLIYFEKGREALEEHMENLHEGFREEVERTVRFLQEESGGRFAFRYFFTDRDGTINNYCGRYNSSIQSAYNALLLHSLIVRTHESVILTSAPLRDTGIVDLSLFPPGNLLYAGSKGREFLNRQGERVALPLREKEERMMERLNDALRKLCREPEHRKFTLLGSGLQFKFGQTTVARQDIFRSVPEEESLRFRREIRRLMEDLDPAGEYFRMEDTGLDLELILTVGEKSEALRDFHKGDGLHFLFREAGLSPGGHHLVAGDTFADLPLVRASRELSEKTTALFVTRDDSLRKKLREEAPSSLVVPEVDMLVFALDRFARLP